MTDNKQTLLEGRINDLECQLAFQEQTIDSLNNALSEQQLLISKMQTQMQFLVGKIKTIDSSPMADESEETPPPHY
ncbi:SlyX family protein [Vibrio profundum]|uniref:SlyX family protein n=1 Tax=Vibrio profundum TaxID=2910247 RepID=UPI003D0CF0C0